MPLLPMLGGCNNAPTKHLGVEAMKTKTTKFMGKTVAVYGKRKRIVKNRFGLSMGETFAGLHVGKTSHYLPMPMFSKRKFGGVRDIVKAV